MPISPQEIGNVLLFCSILAVGGTLLSKWLQIPKVVFFLTSGLVFTAGMLTTVPSSPLFFGLGDGAAYLNEAEEFVALWAGGGKVGWTQGWPSKQLWPLIIGALATIGFGSATHLVLLNSSFVGLSALLITKAANLIHGGGTSPLLPTVLLVSSPSILIWGGSLYRESFFWAGISCLVVGIAQLAKLRVGLFIGWTFAGTAVTILFRPEFGLLVSYWSVVAGIAVAIAHWGALQRGSKLAVSITAGVSLIMFPWLYRLTTYNRASLEDVSGRVATTRRYLSREGVNSAFGKPSDAINAPETGQAIFDFLASAVTAFAGPPPWSIDSTFSLSSLWFLGTLHWLLLLALALLSLRRRSQDVSGPLALGLMSMAAFVMLIVSVTLTNYGIVARLRVPAELMLIPLAHSFLAGPRLGSQSPFGSAHTGDPTLATAPLRQTNFGTFLPHVRRRSTGLGERGRNPLGRSIFRKSL